MIAGVTKCFMRDSKAKRQAGFSLIELMVTVSVSLIVLLVGVPSFQQTLQSMRGSSVVDSLTFAVNYTRNEAVTRNQRVQLCASDDGVTCNAAATSWSTGWIVQLVNAPNTVLRHWQLNTPGGTVFLSGNNSRRVIYNAQGEVHLSNNVNTATAVQFETIVDGVTSTARCLDITAYGSMTVSRQEC